MLLEPDMGGREASYALPSILNIIKLKKMQNQNLKT